MYNLLNSGASSKNMCIILLKIKSSHILNS